MPHSEPKLFPPISLKEHSLLPYSRLYSPEPVGIETPLVESMASYLSRVAKAHCWLTGTLLTYEVVPVVNKPYMCDRGDAGGSTLSRIRSSLKTINGVAAAAADFVAATEFLTLRCDLRFLTLLCWKDVLPTRNLLRNVKAWCPDCYRQRRTVGGIAYEPLLWAVEAVQLCAEHRRPLVTRCPFCDKNLPVLNYFSRPGHCSECREWLGAVKDEHFSQVDYFSSDELEWQLWVAKSVGELLAASTTLPLTLSGNEITRSLSACIRRTSCQTLSRFASLLGRQKNTVWGWRQGKNKPTLLDLLQICYCTGCSLLEFITADKAFLRSGFLVKGNQINSTWTMKKTRRVQALDHAAVKQSLEDMLRFEEAVSVREAARRVKHGVKTLYRCFPDLCKRISERSDVWTHLIKGRVVMSR